MSTAHHITPTVTRLLNTWIKTQLGALYQSTSESQTSDNGNHSNFTNVFDATFSPQAHILLNHKQISREALKERISSSQFATIRNEVDWKDMIETSPGKDDNDGDQGLEVGIVAGFFVVTRSLKFRIRVGPAQRLQYNSFSAKLQEDPTATAGNDKLRITEFFLTTKEEAAPINLRGFGPTTSDSTS